MACHAPLLYNYYQDRLGRLFDQDKQLKKNFPSTIFAAATYNFGPRTECYEHTDPGNLSCGWCSVTPFGPFDHTKGGHLVLWDCKLVIEFPAGSTILLPSAIVAHSNTAIQPGEKRYSFALYSAGALFRWVENDFQRSVDYYGSLNQEERESADAEDLARWKFYLSLLPVIGSKVDTPPM